MFRENNLVFNALRKGQNTTTSGPQQMLIQKLLWMQHVNSHLIAASVLSDKQARVLLGDSGQLNKWMQQILEEHRLMKKMAQENMHVEIRRPVTRGTKQTLWDQICKSIIDDSASYFNKEPLTDSEFEDATISELELEVSAVLASFLIELSAVDQPSEMKYLEEKDYSKFNRLKLKVPVPVPVSFGRSAGRDRTIIGFFSTRIMSAREACDMTIAALKSIAERNMQLVTMTNVEPEYFNTKLLDELVEARGCSVLYREEEEYDDDDITNITMKVLNKEGSNEEALRKIFKECCLLKCKKCGEWYNEHDKVCYKKHTGELLEDVDGNEYEIEVDEETGEEYHIEEWTCCGEVYREDDGCIPDDERIYHPNGEHEFDKEASKIKITTCKIPFSLRIVGK